MVFDSSNSISLLREDREVTESVTRDKIINKIIPLHSRQMGHTEEEEEAMGFLTTWEHLTPGNKIKIVISSISMCAQMEPAIHDTKLMKDSSDLNSNKKPKLYGKLIVLISLKIEFWSVAFSL